MEIEHTTLTLKRGDTFVRTLYFEDENGNALDITGWTIYFTVKKSIDDSDDDAIIKKDITSHTDPENGKSELELTPTETAQSPGTYCFDIQIKDTQGKILTILEGEIIFTKDVTQRTD